MIIVLSGTSTQQQQLSCPINNNIFLSICINTHTQPHSVSFSLVFQLACALYEYETLCAFSFIQLLYYDVILNTTHTHTLTENHYKEEKRKFL
jgi:hypothetical protein